MTSSTCYTTMFCDEAGGPTTSQPSSSLTVHIVRPTSNSGCVCGCGESRCSRFVVVAACRCCGPSLQILRPNSPMAHRSGPQANSACRVETLEVSQPRPRPSLTAFLPDSSSATRMHLASVKGPGSSRSGTNFGWNFSSSSRAGKSHRLCCGTSSRSSTFSRP